MPQLHPERVVRHYQAVRMAAATARSTAESDGGQRHVAATSMHNGLQVGGSLVVAGAAPDQDAEPACLGQHRAGGRELVSHAVDTS
jgi:hypothetical protein